MKTTRLPCWCISSALCLYLTCGSHAQANQNLAESPVIKLTAELQVDSWSFWLLEDTRGRSSNNRSIFRSPDVINCVVGTNTWAMSSDQGFIRNARVSFQFTGQGIAEHVEIISEPSQPDTERLAKHPLLAGGTPPIGHKYDRAHATIDGNPGNPTGVMDLMTLNARIGWLAFCSSSTLKSPGRQLYPPSDIWKQLVSAPEGFKDQTTVFEDALGLPRSVELFTDDQQTIFRYQVHQTTNVMGWTVPTEFYAIQYRPTATKGWQTHMTVKGRVTAIEVRK